MLALVATAAPLVLALVLLLLLGDIEPRFVALERSEGEGALGPPLGDVAPLVLALVLLLLPVFVMVTEQKESKKGKEKRKLKAKKIARAVYLILD